MPALFLALLVLYVLLGAPSVTFHGDEAMQVYMSSDYATIFFDRAPERLLSYPPFAIDSDAHLRLINGSVNRYLIGLSWHLGGYPRESLPPRPGWDWGLSYADNVATGHRPAPDFMTLARASSALLTGAAVLLMFAIGWRVGGAPAAVLASLIFALHPVVLLNGRRAMQEGAMLAFGLLTVYAALLIVSAGDGTRRCSVGRWMLLAAAGALTLASKHSGVIFLAAAYAWAAVDAAWRGLRLGDLTMRRAAGRFALLIISGVVTLALWVALSPALWSAPLERFGDLLAARAELLDIQVAIDPVAPMTFDQRLLEIVRQPFTTPAQHFEVASWGEAPAVQDEIAAYLASPLSGAPYGVVVGGALTVFAGIGAVAALRRRQSAWLALWAGVVALSLLANPLPWQRYYLPLIPPAILLAAVGMRYSYGVVRRAFSEKDA